MGASAVISREATLRLNVGVSYEFCKPQRDESCSFMDVLS